MIADCLQALGFEAQETKTYLTLLKTGALTVGNLSRRLGVPRTTLYGYLSRLSDRGLASESLRRGVKVYSAETPDKIVLLFSQRQAQIEAAQKQFMHLLPSLRSDRKSVLTSPRFQLYEGEEGLRNVLKDMLLYSDLETCSFWPIRQMMNVLSSEFFHFHNLERIERKLFTRAIWPQSEAVALKKFPFLGSGPEFQREVRIAPPDVAFSLGYWFYANKVAFLASSSEGFGFIIESQELVETMKAQFEIMWRLSTRLPCSKEDVKSFVAELTRRSR